MKLNTYLTFNGNCEAALKFYAQVLGGKVVMMLTYADAPEAEHPAPDSRDKIMHGRIEVGDGVLMASDAPPARFHEPQGFSVNIGVTDPQEADRIFAALAEGGAVMMPIAETFWAVRFGMVKDRFGTPWMVNCERPA